MAASLPQAIDWVSAGSVGVLAAQGRTVIQAAGTPVLVIWDEDQPWAIDNRCPHLGFPLARGDVADGLLDCHWHHARFDLSCGDTLDPWADDVTSYRVEVREGEVWVDPQPARPDAVEHGLGRLQRGLEHSLRLVLAKAVRGLATAEAPVGETLARAARHGATEREDGWQPGLSILAAVANVLPGLAEEDQLRGLVHATTRIAQETRTQPRRRLLPPLQGSSRDRAGLTSWFRHLVEVRDAAGGQRVMHTLVHREGRRAAFEAAALACSDHRYMDGGHSLDHVVKCAELADRLTDAKVSGAEDVAALLFTSLVPRLCTAERMEETSAWRRPFDIAAVVESMSAQATEAWPQHSHHPLDEAEEDALVTALLDEDHAVGLQALLGLLEVGHHPFALAAAVLAAATERVLRFAPANEVADWDTVHHTQTYANAAAEALHRAPGPETFRLVIDAAASVWLDRFLNVPAARMPGTTEASADGALEALVAGYDARRPVVEATAHAWTHQQAGGGAEELFRTLGHVVAREDSGFHDVQQLEIAWRQLDRRGSDDPRVRLALVACARWLAAQYPTRRAAEQTFQVARRLARGDALYERDVDGFED